VKLRLLYALAALVAFAAIGRPRGPIVRHRWV